MVHSAVQTESKIRGADSWVGLEHQAVDHEAGVESFSHASFELPAETLQAGDEVAAATLVFFQQGEEKEVTKVEENVSKALAGLEVTTLPPAAATESTHIGVEGFEGNYGGIEFSNDGSTLPEDFEGINDAWGGGLDASEFVGPKKVPKDRGLGGLEFLETSEPPAAAVAKAGGEEKIEDMLVKKTEMKGPEMYIVEEISAEFRESLLARVGLMGMVYLKTMPPKSSSDDKETEFSFKVEGTDGVKRFAVQSSRTPLLKVSPKAVLNRSERELKWHIDEIPLKGNPGRLRARMPLEIGEDDDGSDLEIFGYVKFSAQGLDLCLGFP
ncbi:hypothetical protein Sango_2039100 [Sesamum angolense]|uniref:Uncharacterized protein n=1 Tax=Sesamum angolense TaxID=2727404 RepID=A0AAE2BP97_9LAMI|nr:hypothetical protein Sango_2039100 [Sesamum angolense]